MAVNEAFLRRCGGSAPGGAGFRPLPGNAPCEDGRVRIGHRVVKGADDSVVGEIIDSLPGLDAIRDEYIELFQRARNPSFFCSFQFVRTAWVNFHGRRDRRLVLAVREAEKLVGIAPFIIEPEMLLPKVPFRVIKFVAEWGDGDKPRLVTTQDEAWMWTRIQGALDARFHGLGRHRPRRAANRFAFPPPAPFGARAFRSAALPACAPIARRSAASGRITWRA